jgi:hypothetical protein
MRDPAWGATQNSSQIDSSGGFLAISSAVRTPAPGRNPLIRRRREIDPVTPRILRSGRSRQLARSAVIGDRPMVRAFPRNTLLPPKNP